MFESIELHAFGDASEKGDSAAVYVVIKQKTVTNQDLITGFRNRARIFNPEKRAEKSAKSPCNRNGISDQAEKGT